MNEQNIAKVSVIDPIGKAIDRVKEVLFNPFDVGRWFIIGFCAWLAMLGQGGVGGGGGSFNPGGGGPSSAEVKAWFLEHLPLIISIGLGLFVLGIVIGIVFLWLSSRGRFMFLHCVALNKAEVKAPWHKFRNQSNSLFVFRLVLGVIGFICIGVMVGVLALLIILLVRNSAYAAPALVVGIILLVLMVIGIRIVFALINKFTKDFVVPIMYLRGSRCLDAWREFWSMLTSNKWRFTLYILFQIVIAICVGMIAGMIGCLVSCFTCCIFIPAMIPILGLPFLLLFTYILTLVLLPLHIFGRSYSLYYLAQYGGQYDVFIPIAQLQEPPIVGPQGEEPVNEPPKPVQ